MGRIMTKTAQHIKPDADSAFITTFRGSFTSMLRWPQLDQLWQVLREQNFKCWYIYAVGEAPPQDCADSTQLHQFIHEIDKLLRQEHQEEYCGIVYADKREDPGFIKIYDPSNLGVSCGFSDKPPLPGWILSLDIPADLSNLPQAGNRRRWWQKIFD
ncbi:hypothetical protein MNBD_GAMMA24-2119 [hydrothermal vent metagenome]|uniref:Uncharacterized protein n=1 Tax=hydrothermal vent metagenome TaxID=652676 RepID=A0A3B1BBD1_9ZZZZ